MPKNKHHKHQKLKKNNFLTPIASLALKKSKPAKQKP
jgi:hypothetical protein